MKHMVKFTALVCCSLAAASLFAADPATGWKQTAVGTYDYNNTDNWVDGEINGIFGSDLTLEGAQTITFAADTALTNGLTIAYSGTYRMYFTTAEAADSEVRLTLKGDILLDTVDNGNVIVDIGSTTAGRGVLVDLGGAVRTVKTTGTKHEIRFLNKITNGGLDLQNNSKLTFNSTESDYDLGTAFNGNGQIVVMPNSLGTGSLVFNTKTSFATSGDRTFTNDNKLVFNADLSVSGANGSLNLGAGDIVINAPVAISMSKNTLTLGGKVSEESPYGIDAVRRTGTGGVVSTHANIAVSDEVELYAEGQWDFHGAISGSGRIVKTGDGELDLFSQNTFKGKFVIRGGKVRFRATNVFPSPDGMFLVEEAGELRSNSGAEAGYLTVPRMLYMVDKASTGALGIDSGSESENIDLSDYPGVRIATSGGNNVSYTGNITAPSTGILRLGGGGKTLKIGGKIIGATEIDASTGSIQFDVSQPNFDGTITCGAGYTLTVGSSVELASADLISNDGTILFASAKEGEYTRARSVTLNRALLKVDSPSKGAVVHKIASALKPGIYERGNGGISNIEITNSGANDMTLQAGSIESATGVEMLYVKSTHTGAGALKIKVDDVTGLCLTGTGQPGTAYAPVSSFVRMDESLVTYDSGAGLRPLNENEYDLYEAGYEGPLLNSGANIATSGSGTITLTAGGMVNSVWMKGAASADQTFTASDGVTLTVLSGAVQVNSYGAAKYEVGTDFGEVRGYFCGRSGTDWTLSGVIDGSGGLTFADFSRAQSSKGVHPNTSATFSGDCYLFGYCWPEPNGGSFFPNGTERRGNMYVFGKMYWKGTHVRINGLYGYGAIAQDGGATGSLTVGLDGSNGDYSGSFVNAESNFYLTKEGSGMQCFDCDMKFKYSCNINGGTLQIDGTLTTTKSGDNVYVNNGGTLSGCGTIAGSQFEQIKNGGTLAPGSAQKPNVPMTLLKELQMEDGASMKFYIGEDRASQAIVAEGYGITGTAETIPVTVDCTVKKKGSWLLLEADTFNGNVFVFTTRPSGGRLVVKNDETTNRAQLWFEQTTGLYVTVR